MEQILLVEGNDEIHVFSQICEKFKIKETFKIEEQTGYDNIIKGLPIRIKSDLKTIGIVIDADSDSNNIINKWNSLTNILSSAGYKIPKKPEVSGTIISNEDLPIIGIWIMPNNKEDGMLEDFVEYLIPKNDKTIPFVNKTLETLEKEKVSNYKEIHKSKARIHTWLAWQESPGVPMGLAIKKKYLDTNNETCLTFVNWLNKLFNTSN